MTLSMCEQMKPPLLRCHPDRLTITSTNHMGVCRYPFYKQIVAASGYASGVCIGGMHLGCASGMCIGAVHWGRALRGSTRGSKGFVGSIRYSICLQCIYPNGRFGILSLSNVFTRMGDSVLCLCQNGLPEREIRYSIFTQSYLPEWEHR